MGLPFYPPSGAAPLSTQETDYMVNTLHQMIDMAGMPVLYKIQVISGMDAYEHPVITYTEKTINGVISNIIGDEYSYVETGFLPTHYANLWVYNVEPQIGDRVDWNDIEWEVRGSYPVVIGNRTVYYQVIIRRVLSTGGTSDGASDGGSDGGNSGGTLQSGGQLTQLGQDDP